MPAIKSTRFFGLAMLSAVVLSACGGHDDSRATVNLSGTVTFDRVPHFTDSGGLDYPLTVEAPARGVQVLLLNRAGDLLDSDTTTAEGSYSLQAPAATDVRVRVQARMQRDGSPSWNFSVTDNTQGNALYVLDGQFANSGRADSVRDLHAVSGWTGDGYAELRPAAPFAILDVVYEAMEQVRDVDPAVQFPPLEIRWSTANRAVSADKMRGDIGTTFYSIEDQSIYLLGEAGNDTDEYDRSVIAHEFAHYLEYQLGRTDSIGGNHSMTAKLDMRVAFSEGWSNAFAAITTADAGYRDSIGVGQNGGLYYSLEANPYGNAGWFSENSVQKILYDLYDPVNENFDQISLGFAPIYQTLISDAWRQFDGATSIYPFIQQLKENPTVDGLLIDALLETENIAGTDAYGANETNDGSFAPALPVYHRLAAGGSVEVCGSKAEAEGEYNRLDVRRFVLLELPDSGSYDISAERVEGLAPANPDFVLWQDGEPLEIAASETTGREQISRSLDSGTYWLEVYEQANVDQNPDTGGAVCFNLSLGFSP